MQTELIHDLNRNNLTSKRTLALRLFLLLSAMMVASAQAQTLTTLYTFGSTPNDGQNPAWTAGVVMDSKGNLYGTTSSGGAYGYGTVFQLSPPTKRDGNWRERTLHSFGADANDGRTPRGGLVLDRGGNMYGVTWQGGVYGGGIAFRMNSNGRITVLHNFGGSSPDGTPDGLGPMGGMVMDAKGDLYGTTVSGGAYGYGTVFKLASLGKNAGTETILYNFGTDGCADGTSPYSSLLLDASGNLYGTTWDGGAGSNCIGDGGTVFKIDTSYNYTVLHSFSSTDGVGPMVPVIMDPKGNLYGTTFWGGAYTQGTVFNLNASTGYTETVLYHFHAVDGLFPAGPVLLDESGNLYGTTCDGGAVQSSYLGFGIIFKLNASSNSESILHMFGNNDGRCPSGGMIRDASGNLYGTTYNGGSYDKGTVFKLAP